jgi:hypothetical protein
MPRRLLVATLCLLAVATPALAVPDARLVVSDVAVTPDAPVTGEPVTVTATVRNSGGSPSPVTVDEVRLRTDDGTTLAEAGGPGSLSAGETLTVDLVASFDEPGRYDLTLVAVGEDENDRRVTVRRPVTVVVEPSDPALEVAVDRAVAGVETRAAVTVSNPATTPVRDLLVTLETRGAIEDRRVVPTLAGGESTTVNVTFRPPEAGTAVLDVSLAYTTGTGERTDTEYVRQLRVDPLREDVGVAISPVSEDTQEVTDAGQLGALLGGGGATQQDDEGEDRPTRVSVEVTNFGNAPVREVVVTPRVDDRTLPRRAVDPLAPGESATVEVDLAGVAPGELVAETSYRVADRTGSASGRFDYRPPVGRVTVTDVALSFTEDGTLTVTGNAGNTGRAELTGVVVAVGESEGVSPAYPQRDYFVGTVEGSEFAPFELTADIDAESAESIPVHVRYTVDGEQRTRTVELPYDGDPAPSEQGRQRGLGGLPVSLVALGVAGGLLVVGIPLLVLRSR